MIIDGAYRIAIIGCLLAITAQIHNLKPQTTYIDGRSFYTTNKVSNTYCSVKASQEAKSIVITPKPVSMLIAEDKKQSSFLTGYTDGSLYAGHTINFNQDTAVSFTVTHTPFFQDAGISISKRW